MTALWLKVTLALAALGAGTAFGLGGPIALAGFGLGLAATAFSVTVLWLVIRLWTESAARSRFVTLAVVVAFLLKLPLFVLLGNAAQALGPPAPACFLGGLALVYSALVGWALIPR